MSKFIFLDSSPLSDLARPTGQLALPAIQPIGQWAIDCDAAGHTIIVSEIIDYEVRRELLRARKSLSVSKLDAMKFQYTFFPLDSTAILKAAELWAQSRLRGQPTAHPDNIDVDVILAAQIMTSGLPLSDCIVATSNPAHLSQFVPADLWQNITP